MKVNEMRDFIAIEKTRDIKKAAEGRSITPSTMLRHMNHLEKELEVKLFKNDTKELSITDYGAVFLPYAHQICDVEDLCLKDILSEESHKYQLRVGYIHALDSFQIKEFLFRFQEENAFVDTYLYADGSHALKKQVISGECDVAFVLSAGKENHPLLNTLPVAKNQLYAIVPATHPLADYGTLKFEQLEDEPLLTLPEGSAVHTICRNECTSLGFEPRIRFTSSSLFDIVEFVSLGHGIGVIPCKPMAFQMRKDVVLIKLTSTTPLATELIYRKDSISPSIYYFLTSIDTFLQ